VQKTLRERIARVERQGAQFVEPRDVLKIARLAGIELACFAQPAVREVPFLDRRQAALRFPGFDKNARFEAAQIGDAAR